MKGIQTYNFKELYATRSSLRNTDIGPIFDTKLQLITVIALFLEKFSKKSPF